MMLVLQWWMQNRIGGGAGLFFFLSLSLFFFFPPPLLLPHPPHISIDAPAVGGLEPPSPPVDLPLRERELVQEGWRTKGFVSIYFDLSSSTLLARAPSPSIMYRSTKGQREFGVSDLLTLFGSWHLVYLSEEAFGWLSMRQSQPRSCFGLLYSKIRYLQNSVLMVNDCKPTSLRGFLEPMFFQWFLGLVVSNEWLLRSSKAYLVRVFAGVPFLCCLFSAIFNLLQAVDDRSKKMTILIFDVFLFF